MARFKFDGLRIIIDGLLPRAELLVGATEVEVGVRAVGCARCCQRLLQQRDGVYGLTLIDQVGTQIVVGIAEGGVKFDGGTAARHRIFVEVQDRIDPAEEGMGFGGRIEPNGLAVGAQGPGKVAFTLEPIALVKKLDSLLPGFQLVVGQIRREGNHDAEGCHRVKNVSSRHNEVWVMEKQDNIGSVRHTWGKVAAGLPTLLVVMLVLSGCSLLFGGGAEEAPVGEEQIDRSIVPTFTPTPELPPTPEPAAEAPTEELVQVPVTDSEEAAAPEAPAEGEAAPAAEEPAEEPIEEPVEEPTATPEPPTPTPGPKLTVNIPAANVRNGPGTNYGLAGAVEQGQSFDIVGKNPEGTWWQFCCVNGQEVWIFGELVTADNAGSVAVAQNIPAPPEPVAAAPAPVEQAPAPEPPAEEPPPAPAAANAGACGGDDGCKFRISGGPVKMQNSGFELKIQAAFIHSGVDGGQMQGDYRIGIEKDGQLITTFGDTRSIALTSNDGPAGRYNYEAKVGVDQIPGGNLAGTYFFWVLDGNRERDSEVFRMDLGGNEGEVYIEFDQG